MSHDVQAAWAATEIVSNFRADPSLFLHTPPTSSAISVYATSEAVREWPVADGLIRIEIASQNNYDIALEFKRVNEGLHGILTALGQAHAYLHKGFSASIIAIPKKYTSHNTPGDHVKSIIETTSPGCPIGVVVYDEPDTSITSPFTNKLDFLRNLNIDQSTLSSVPSPVTRVTKTQWGHVREGSTEPDAFFHYLKIAKALEISDMQNPSVVFPQALHNACNSISPRTSIFKYLSNSVNDSFHDRVWRHFWFNCIFHNSAVPIWRFGPTVNYQVNNEYSRVKKWDGSFKKFFVGRSDSIKNIIVNDLNNNSINEVQAWRNYAVKVRDRAHSYREDIDSGLSAFGFLEADGKPTSLGYDFVDSCERTGDCYSGVPLSIFRSALLNNANFGAFLHYIFRLSEEKFSTDPLSFTTGKTNLRFDKAGYLRWLVKKLSSQLCVMRTVSPRGGHSRNPFQGEFAILRHLKIVEDFRIGVGLEINWPEIQEAIQYPV